ncbi:hypothetical protein RUND412_002787 [Rhizina undulata]
MSVAGTPNPPQYGAYPPQEPQGGSQQQQYYPEQNPVQNPQPAYLNQDGAVNNRQYSNPVGYDSQYPIPVNPTPQLPQQGYISALPLGSLNRSPAPVDCPLCGQRSMTTINFETGTGTHVWAGVLCFFFCFGCIPYLLNGTKDVHHHCGYCNASLATWHRSGGGVEIHAHPMGRINGPQNAQAYQMQPQPEMPK